jgi:TonB family protein
LEPIQSRLTLEGVLADRPLLSQFTLTSWPATEILTNSVVQTGVDDKGTVVSAVLLTSCGSTKADAKALMLARSARFEPLHPSRLGPPSTILAWGNMVFRWQTIVPSTTNAAPGNTSP